jgi:hypothetical protein
MPNAVMPVILVAHEIFRCAIANALGRKKALALARVYAPGHAMANGVYWFSDEEIVLGVCACEACVNARTSPPPDPSRRGPGAF